MVTCAQYADHINANCRALHQDSGHLLQWSIKSRAERWASAVHFQQLILFVKVDLHVRRSKRQEVQCVALSFGPNAFCSPSYGSNNNLLPSNLQLALKDFLQLQSNIADDKHEYSSDCLYAVFPTAESKAVCNVQLNIQNYVKSGAALVNMTQIWEKMFRSNSFNAVTLVFKLWQILIKQLKKLET